MTEPSTTQTRELKPEQLLNMIWANEPDVAIYIFAAPNPRGMSDERRLIQIRKGDTVLASATVELHNRDSFANSVSPYISPFGLAKKIERYFEVDPAEETAEWCEASSDLRREAQAIINNERRP